MRVWANFIWLQESSKSKYGLVRNNMAHLNLSGQDSVVGIATGYGLDDQGFEPPRCELFRTPPDQPQGPPSLLYNRYRIFFPRLMPLELRVNHPALSSAEVVYEYSYNSNSPCSFLACLTMNFTTR